jgi:hypothetical protein
MKNLIFLLFLGVGLTFISCRQDGDGSTDGGGNGNGSGVNEPVIAEDFTVVGRWNFETVEAEGQIQGVSQSDKDNNPTGYVLFNEDGTGIFDFGINLLAMEFGKLDSITWTRESDELVRIVESDGDINDWSLIRGNAALVEASWDVNISTNNFATFTAVLTHE